MFSIQIQIVRINLLDDFDTILHQIKTQGFKMIEYTLKEYAEIKGIAYRTVLWQINKGLLQSVKRGRQRYIQMSEPTNEAGLQLKDLILSLSAEIKKLKARIEILEEKIQEKERTKNGRKRNYF